MSWKYVQRDEDGKYRTTSSGGGGGGASALTDLDDVSVSSPTDGQILTYDDATDKWVNSNPSSGHTYSTTEQVIGTWIDGKPLYEKSYIYENSSGSAGGSSGAVFDVWNLGNDKVIISDGLQCTFVNLATNKMYPLPYADSAFTNIYVDNGIVKLRVRNDDWGSNYKLYMTARYIKTTD